MFQEIQIQPRDVYEHFIYVQRPGTTLHWTFTTRKKNIHFGLFWRGGSPMTTATTQKDYKQQQSSFPESHRSFNSLSSTIEPLTPNGDILQHQQQQQQQHKLTGTDTSSFTSGQQLPQQQQQLVVNINKGKRHSLTHNTALHQSRRKSTASLHLLENKFQEVIPISHTHSSEEQIHGSYMVSEPGNCVLIFDNTTSINTSKILRFTVTSDEPIQENTKLNRSHDMDGYLLKKRRKRMQGWAKRWFELLPNGTLCYSVAPGGIKRGSIQITMTMITIYPKQRTIHLDTGTTIYHLKSLTKEDFDKWVDEFRRQRAISHRDKTAGIMVDGAWLLPDNRYRLTPKPTKQRQIGNNSSINDGDGDDFDDDDEEDDDDDDDDQEDDDDDEPEDFHYFKECQQHLEQDFKQMAHDLETLSIGLQDMKKTWNGSSSIAHTISGNASSSSPSSSPTSSPTANSKRRFTFRRGSTQPPSSSHSLSNIQGGATASPNQQQQQQIVTNIVDSSSSSSTHHQTTVITSATSGTTLDSLMESLQHVIDLRNSMEQEYGKQQRYWRKLKKQQRYGSPPHYHRQHQGSEFGTPRSLSFYSYHSSNHSDLYYDAEEFDMTLDEDDDCDLVEDQYDVDDDTSSLEDVQNDDGDSLVSNSTTIKPHPSSSLHAPSSPLPERSISVIQRRTILPHPVAGKNVNLLSILRKNIGKDLSTITMPISLNEPLNLLQRLCEELECSDLLDKANDLNDSLDRLMYVTIFSISGFASSQYRIGRKFWNPLLFETYECLRPDKGFRFVSEKVSHRPNIMACHAESNNFTFWQSTEGSTKFWGKSMEFISEGTVNIKLPKHDDHFTYTKPSSHMRNMLFGTRYLEHLGQTKVTNHATGDYATVTFKEARRNGGDSYYFGGGGAQWERNEVEVLFYTSNSTTTPVRKIVGKWSQSLSQDLGDKKYKLLWQVQPPNTDNPADYYGFTQFCMELNEITSLEQNHLPPTDTRLRPDQYLFEKGDVDQAEKEKERVEILQRERRNQYETSGMTPTPFWFRPSTQDPSQWEYKGGYWEARKSGQWPNDMPNLW